MALVKNVTVSNGSVTFYPEIEPGEFDLDAAPAFFEVAFMLDAETEVDALKVRNIFHLRARVAGLSEETPYAEVEARAFEQLGPMLSALARKINKARA